MIGSEVNVWYFERLLYSHRDGWIVRNWPGEIRIPGLLVRSQPIGRNWKFGNCK